MAKAPINLRSLARSYTEEAINTLAGLMRASPNHFVRVAAANSLLDRGYGKPKGDAEGGEQLTITIRKILEIGAPPLQPKTNGEVQVIEHDDAEVRQAETHNHRNGGDDV